MSELHIQQKSTGKGHNLCPRKSTPKTDKGAGVTAWAQGSPDSDLQHRNSAGFCYAPALQLCGWKHRASKRNRNHLLCQLYSYMGVHETCRVDPL